MARLDLTTLKIGDEVGYSRGEHGNGFSTVTKINGHGHITLANGEVFDKHDQRRADGKYSRGTYLCDPATLRKHIARRDAQRQVDLNINAMIEMIRRRKNGYGSFCGFTAEEKAAFMTLAETLPTKAEYY